MEDFKKLEDHIVELHAALEGTRVSNEQRAAEAATWRKQRISLEVDRALHDIDNLGITSPGVVYHTQRVKKIYSLVKAAHLALRDSEASSADVVEACEALSQATRLLELLFATFKVAATYNWPTGTAYWSMMTDLMQEKPEKFSGKNLIVVHAKTEAAARAKAKAEAEASGPPSFYRENKRPRNWHGQSGQSQGQGGGHGHGHGSQSQVQSSHPTVSRNGLKIRFKNPTFQQQHHQDE